MKRLKVLSILVLALTVLIVVLQNTEQVETKILFASVVMPRALLLGVTLLVGFSLGILVAGRLSRTKAKKTKKQATTA